MNFQKRAFNIEGRDCHKCKKKIQQRLFRFQSIRKNFYQDKSPKFKHQKSEILEVENRAWNLRFSHVPEICGKTDLEKDFRKMLQEYIKTKECFPEIIIYIELISE